MTTYGEVAKTIGLLPIRCHTIVFNVPHDAVFSIVPMYMSFIFSHYFRVSDSWRVWIKQIHQRIWKTFWVSMVWIHPSFLASCRKDGPFPLLRWLQPLLRLLTLWLLTGMHQLFNKLGCVFAGVKPIYS